MESPGTRSATTVKQDRVPFLAYPSSRASETARRQCLIFVVPGNPGLVGYYKPFMKTLRELLDEKETRDGCGHAFHIYGRNLLGFEDADHEPAFGTLIGHARTDPFTLEDQIQCCCQQVQEINQSALGEGRMFDHVVLIGHSVGAYVALEVFNRHHHARREGTGLLGDVKLTAGILLFPTISDIAQSSSGKRLDLLRRTLFLDRTAHHIAKGFVNLWPRWLLEALVRRVLGFPEHAATATLRFLSSRDGIWQALHMGKDEMKTITEEKWGDDLWEIQEAKEGVPGLKTKFFLYFARKDHWVADECRDAFIERRNKHEKGRTRIVVDEERVPHAFCIHHSESVAEKVKLWIENIAGL